VSNEAVAEGCGTRAVSRSRGARLGFRARKPPSRHEGGPPWGTVGVRARRHLVDEPLRVAAPLVGQPLASPARRLAAIVIDGVLVLVPSILVVLAAVGVTLRLREQAAMGGLESPTPWCVTRRRASSRDSSPNSNRQDFLPS